MSVEETSLETFSALKDMLGRIRVAHDAGDCEGLKGLQDEIASLPEVSQRQKQTLTLLTEEGMAQSDARPASDEKSGDGLDKLAGESRGGGNRQSPSTRPPSRNSIRYTAPSGSWTQSGNTARFNSTARYGNNNGVTNNNAYSNQKEKHH